MIRAEGERIAATADTPDREKIETQLQSLAERWTDLLDKAGARYVSSAVRICCVTPLMRPTYFRAREEKGLFLPPHVAAL